MVWDRGGSADRGSSRSGREAMLTPAFRVPQPPWSRHGIGGARARVGPPGEDWRPKAMPVLPIFRSTGGGLRIIEWPTLDRGASAWKEPLMFHRIAGEGVDSGRLVPAELQEPIDDAPLLDSYSR